MDKFLNSKFMKWLQNLGQKLGENKGINALQSALMGSMGIIMVGAIFQICAVVAVNLHWMTAESPVYMFFYGVYNLTMNFLSLWFVIQLGYTYAKSLKLNAMTGALNSAICFILVASGNSLGADWITGSMTTVSVTNFSGKIGRASCRERV